MQTPSQPRKASADVCIGPAQCAKRLPSRAKQRAVRAQFPDLPNPGDHDDRFFWLCAWLREVAMADALWAPAQSRSCKKATSDVLSNALWMAHTELSQVARQSLRYLVEAGGLLYAFNGTTKTQEVPA